MQLHKIPEFMTYLGGLETDYGLPAGLLGAVMKTESAGQNDARSPVGARGAFQFMPATAKQYGIDPTDPIQSADGSARYLRDSLDKFGNVREAIASYNAGPGRISKTGIKGAPAETKSYLDKVLNFMIPAAEASESERTPPAAATEDAEFTSMTTEELKSIAAPSTAASATDFDSMSNDELIAIAGPPSDDSTSFTGLTPRERGAKAAEMLGPPGAVDVTKNALSGAGYALGDIPAGIEQIASRYLPVTDSYKAGADKRVAEYEAEKKVALDKPGGTAGYVGGQIATAFAPGTGVVKVLSTAGKAAKAVAAARPIVAGAVLTGVKPYETEAERFKEAGISAGIGAVVPGIGKVVGGIGKKLRQPAQLSVKTKSLLDTADRLKVKPTYGQISEGLPKYLEEQMRKTPGARDLAERSTRDSAESFHMALGREIGLDDMPVPYLTSEVLAEARTKLSNEYKAILPNITLKKGTAITGELAFNTTKLTAPFSELVMSTISKSDIRKLANIKNGFDKQIAATGEISGEDLKRWKTSIDEFSNDKNIHSAVRERLSEFKKTLKDTFAKSLDETNPDLAGRLRENDRKYANLKTIEDVQQSATNVEGFISGEKLHNAVRKKYGDPKRAGDFGELSEIGRKFYSKLPDSGTADRARANAILNFGKGAAVAGGSLGDMGTTAAVVASGYVGAKGASHAYYNTPGYQKIVKGIRKGSETVSRVAGSGAGRTGQPEEKTRNALR